MQNGLRMLYKNLLEQMFPGDSSSGLPIFSSDIAESRSWMTVKELSKVNEIIKLVRNTGKVEDVNEVLKLMSKHDPALVKNFMAEAIKVYFSHPSVVSVFRDGEQTLFPSGAVLPEIDFDLLEPVLNKSPKGQ